MTTSVTLLVWNLGPVTAGFVAGVLSRRRRERTERTEGTHSVLSPVSLVPGLLLSGFLFFSANSAWVPAELLDVSGGEPVVGFVIDANSDELVVLQASDRAIVHLARGDIGSRSVCRLEGQPSGRTLFDLVSPQAGPSYPRCPD